MSEFELLIQAGVEDNVTDFEVVEEIASWESEKNGAV